MTSTRTAAEPARGRAKACAVAIPAMVAVLCFLPSLGNGFALDDRVIIADDQPLHHFASLLAALSRAYWYDEGHLYRPLTTLAFGIEWTLGGGHPLLFHAVNVLWHAAVAALVARLALRWWPPLAAGLAGCWFALQPVHAEAVANVVGRSELTCAAAFLGLALLATRAPSGPSFRWPWWTAFALAACALGSKETGVAAPIVAWAAAVTPVPGDRRAATDRHLDAWRLAGGATAGVSCLLIARWLVLGTLAGDAPHYAFALAPGWHGAWLALATIPRAASLVFVPQPPRLDYSPPDAAVLHPNLALAALGALLVVAALATVWVHARRPSPWTFLGVFAISTYGLASNLLVRTGVVLADRTLYSPSVSVAIAAGVAMAAAWMARRWLVVSGLGATAAVGAVLAVEAQSAWRDSPAAFEAIRERSPQSYVGHYMVAEARDAAGDAGGASREYAVAVALTPHHGPLLFMAGANALRRRDTAAAFSLLSRSVALRPDDARARTILVGLDLHRGDTTAACALLREGLDRDSTQREWRSQLNRLGNGKGAGGAGGGTAESGRRGS